MTETETESHTAATTRILAQLAGRWPALFGVEKPVPLAVGIHAALLEAMPDADVTPEQLWRALAQWCKRSCYLTALVAGAERHGLEGVHGEVTGGQAAEAAETLKARNAQRKEKEKAKKARIAEAKQKEEAARAQRVAQAEAKMKKEEARAKAAEAEKARQQAVQARKAKPSVPMSARPQPTPAVPARPAVVKSKPAAAPVVVMVKKRRFAPTAADS